MVYSSCDIITLRYLIRVLLKVFLYSVGLVKPPKTFSSKRPVEIWGVFLVEKVFKILYIRIYNLGDKYDNSKKA